MPTPAGRLGRPRPRRSLAVTALCACLTPLLLGGADTTGDVQSPQIELGGATMGTTYSVKIPDPPAALDTDRLHRRIDRILATVNARMSTYRPDSELSRFNSRHMTDWVPVSANLSRVVRTASKINRVTQGAFDVTIGPLVNLWGFGPNDAVKQPPSRQAIRQALARTGHEYLHARRAPPALKKDKPNLYVDLSGIAKGFGVDRVAEYLESHGIDNYLVEIGGELRGRGHNQRGKAWRVAVEQPLAGQRRIERIIRLHNQSVATSGDYRNFFSAKGRRFAHTIDPRTGRPVQHDLASVVVLHHSTMIADALATALLVLGPNKGLDLARARGLAALLISNTGHELREHVTAAFKPAMIH